MGRLIALILTLTVGGLIAWQSQRPPEPRPASAPATAFSAARAMADVEALARAPHPMGSPENARVRGHLVARMTELGLAPQVRRGVGIEQPRRAGSVIIGGAVENIVGVLPGHDRSAPAVALMAHYDSAAGSAGAADDAAGTAAALEIVRAIKARGVPARDVMVVITDGEEVGLLGANAFFRRDPLARRIGLVLNMETRGGGGRAQMFQTSADNGELVELLRRTAVRPASSSLTVFVYEQMPNDTDLTESLAAGVPGMNYAFIGRQFDYHAASSTPANLEKGSLQDLGQQVLAAAGAAAFAPALPDRAPSRVYSHVAGDLIVAYPPWVGWVVLAAAAALIAVGVRRARRLEAFPGSDVARGGAALLFAVLGAVAILQFARHATGAEVGFLEQRFLLAQASRWETAVMLLGLGFLLLAAAELARGRRLVAMIPLLAGIGCSAFGTFDPLGLATGGAAAVLAVLAYGRPVNRSAAWAGVLLAGLALALAAEALAPPAAFVLAWPLLVAAVAAAATALGARGGYGGLAVIAVLAAVSLGWIGGYAHGSFVSLDLMPVLALPVALAALVLWPLAQPADGAPPGRWLGAALLLAGLAVTAWVRFSDPYDARHPETTAVVYHADLDAGRAFLVSATPDLSDWSAKALGAQAGLRRHWAWRQATEAAPATLVAVAPPETSLSRRADGSLALRLAPPPGGQTVSVQLRPNTRLGLQSLGGVPLKGSAEPGAWTKIAWTGSAEGVELILRPAGPGSLEVRAAAATDWPAKTPPLPPRPADAMAWGGSDATLVTQTRRFAW